MEKRFGLKRFFRFESPKIRELVVRRNGIQYGESKELRHQNGRLNQEEEVEECQFQQQASSFSLSPKVRSSAGALWCCPKLPIPFLSQIGADDRRSSKTFMLGRKRFPPR
jgi:hypothetical protein